MHEIINVAHIVYTETSGLYYKRFKIVNYDSKVGYKLWRHLLMMLEL
jgi:hypothetical protein